MPRLFIRNLQDIVPFILVILVGLAIFLLDRFEFSGVETRKGILAVVAVLKAAYFLRLLFQRLRHSGDEEFFFHQFARFIALSVLLFLVSFALDYQCLYRIDATAFRGVQPLLSIGAESLTFFYFSVSTFTTAGLGDITPGGVTAECFVSLQLLLGWLCTALVISNLAHFRESLTRTNQ